MKHAIKKPNDKVNKKINNFKLKKKKYIKKKINKKKLYNNEKKKKIESNSSLLDWS